MTPKISVSILTADFSNLAHAVESVEAWGADYIHLDIMDGHFVPDITFGPKVCKALRPLTKLPLDVHLMVTEPDKWVEPLADAGANFITVHPEADAHVLKTLQHIRKLGIKSGLALNPGSPISLIDYAIYECDMALIMCVNPGAGGQKFIKFSNEKVAELKTLIDKRKLIVDIEVDGGISPGNALLCVKSGASVLVSGNAVFAAPDPAEAIAQMKRTV